MPSRRGGEPDDDAVSRGDVISGAVLVVGVAVGAVTFRIAALDTVTLLFCGVAQCATSGLALYGWATVGGPVVAFPMIYAWVRTARARFWSSLVALTVIAVGFGPVVLPRSGGGTAATDTHPHLAPYETAAFLAVGAVLLGVLIAGVVRGQVEGRSGNRRGHHLSGMVALAVPQPFALIAALLLA